MVSSANEGGAPIRNNHVRSTSPALMLGALPLLVFLVSPLVAMVLFLSPAEWWLHLQSQTALEAFLVTLRTTTVATVICVAAGLPVAFLLARSRFRGRELVDTLADLPITIPPVVAGVALLLAFGRNGLLGKHLSAWGIEIGYTGFAVIIAQVFTSCPFFIKSARAGFEAVDQTIEQAAWTLGASRWRAFWHVVFPVARPSILAGAVLAFARALSEFGATMMFAGNFPGRTQTLTLAVMSAMETDLQTAVAVSTVTLLVAVVTLVTAKLLVRNWRPIHA